MARKRSANPRLGRVRKGAPGEPAQFEEGSSAPPLNFDAEEIAEELKLWWENGEGQSWLIENDDKTWSSWPETKVKHLMRSLPGRMIALKARDGERIGEVDRVFLHVMKTRRVELAMPALAGHKAGIHDLWGQRVLVKTSPRLVTPVKGDWPTIKALVEGLLDGEQHEQSGYFYAWLKIAVDTLYNGGPGNFRPGQCLIFAGPRNSGKSRLQHQIVTGLLGGRSADPGPYMFGRTDFNSEMFSAEHLCMEDPATTTLTKDRVFFGEMIKQICVNDTQRLHRKREEALTVAPFWRPTISVNDDPDKMRILPLLTPDMKDKIMLFHVSQKPLPMPTSTLDERAAFRAQIAQELPAFAWWLLHEHEIPRALTRYDDGQPAARFGVREWQHPGLALELFDDTPAAELLMLIDAAILTPVDAGGKPSALRPATKLWGLEPPLNNHDQAKINAARVAKGWDELESGLWEGSALDLERLLLGDMDGITCNVAREAKKLFMHNKCDRLLARLKEDQTDRVEHKRTKSGRFWIVSRPGGR